MTVPTTPDEPAAPTEVRVLLVDDQRMVGEMVRRILAPQEGIEFTHCLSATEALEVARSTGPSVILQDLVMPDVDGLTLVDQYRADKATADVPIIVLSTREESEVKVDAFARGANDYIVKLPDPLELVARIRYHSRAYMDGRALADAMEKLRGNEQRLREHERRILDITTAIAKELHVEPLLERIIETVCDILDADRSTVFMHDARTDELWTLATGDENMLQIRFPATMGLAGSSFQSREPINIVDAYQDDRFNRDVDKKTGYRTRSVLTVPVIDKQGRATGVLQALNKRTGPFTDNDARRLMAFGAQIAIALENARLFDEVLRMKNYNESILASMSNGVVTFDAEGGVVKVNDAALRLFGMEGRADDLEGRTAHELFQDANAWISSSIDKVLETGATEVAMDAELVIDGHLRPGIDVAREAHSTNITAVPLSDPKKGRIGGILMIEDISTEKRLKGTMARYMPKEVADRLLEAGSEALGGQLQPATVLFTDIRSFTTISEAIGAQATVAMLNEYFTRMVDALMAQEGVLDKYIGDAIMAVFGVPVARPDDADRAVAAAIRMLESLDEFNRSRASGLEAPVRMGIGINTDEVVSGNIGSLKRMDYTVIGDGVNLAARLEGANKMYGSDILVSEFTVDELKGSYAMREVDRIRVKGKTEPVGVYEILDHLPEEGRADRLELCRQGIEKYRAREFSEAERLFSEAARLAPDDQVPGLYIERCRAFQSSPPPSDWDGTWTMTTK